MSERPDPSCDVLRAFIARFWPDRHSSPGVRAMVRGAIANLRVLRPPVSQGDE